MRYRSIVALLVLLTACLWADKVVYRGDRTLEGVIIEDNLTSLIIEWDLNQSLEIQKSDVVSVTRGDHPAVACRKLYAQAIEAKTADKWLALANLAKEKNLKYYKNEAFQQVLSLDPDNEEAHRGLGHVQHKGKWISNTAKRLSDKWDEKIGDLQKEFKGRPWATVPPIKTQFYEFKCNSTKNVQDRYDAFLKNALFPLYNRLFPKNKFKWYNSEPGKIFVIANIGEFRDYTMVPAGVGGFFRPDTNEVYSFHGSFGIRGTTMHVLAHEALHVYQSRIFKNMSSVPTWLIEGMAVYFGDGAQFGFSFRDDLDAFKADAISIIAPHDRVTPLKMMIQSKNYFPLEKLLLLPHAAFSGRFYSNAWLVVYWCLDGQKLGVHNGEGRALFDEYMLHASTTKSESGYADPKHLKAEAQVFSGMVQKHLGKSVDAWDQELQEFILNLKLKPVGKWENRKWTGLGLVLRCPSGFNIVNQDNLLPGEVVAFGPRVGDLPRISVSARANSFLTRTEPALVQRWIQELYSDIDWDVSPKHAEVGVWPEGTVEAVFTGKRRKVTLPGQKKETSPDIKVRFRATATASRVYFFMCETSEKRYEQDNKKFFTYFFEKRGVELSD